jgi:hypothetical protein
MEKQIDIDLGLKVEWRKKLLYAQISRLFTESFKFKREFFLNDTDERFSIGREFEFLRQVDCEYVEICSPKLQFNPNKYMRYNCQISFNLSPYNCRRIIDSVVPVSLRQFTYIIGDSFINFKRKTLVAELFPQFYQHCINNQQTHLLISAKELTLLDTETRVSVFTMLTQLILKFGLSIEKTNSSSLNHSEWKTFWILKSDCGIRMFIYVTNFSLKQILDTHYHPLSRHFYTYRLNSIYLSQNIFNKTTKFVHRKSDALHEYQFIEFERIYGSNLYQPVHVIVESLPAKILIKMLKINMLGICTSEEESLIRQYKNSIKKLIDSLIITKKS